MTATPNSDAPKPAASWAFPPGALTDLLLPGALWFVSLLVVWPFGDFPLNDDWAFARTVKRFLDTGVYYPSGWAAMPLLTQTLWGALFCLPTGFSFNALRLSTLVLSSAGLVAAYLTMRQVHPSRLFAVVATLALAFNPIYFALSNTFMSDVIFTSFMMGSALFFFRNLSGGKTADLCIATCLALAATLSRPLGLAIPLSYAICLVWMRGVRRGGWWRAIVPLLLCAGALAAYELWLKSLGRLPAYSVRMNLRLYWIFSDPQLLLVELSNHVGTALLYLGWFALPLTALLSPRLDTVRRHFRTWLPAIGVATVFMLCFTRDLRRATPLMPEMGNIVVLQGIGPLTMSGALDSVPACLPSLGRSFWFGVTILAILGGALLLAGAVAAVSRNWRHYRVRVLPAELAGGAFFPVCVCGYLLTVLVVGRWDRYFVPAMPLLFAGAAALAAPRASVTTPSPSATSPKGRAVCAAILILLMALFGVSGTHDYFSWNRARWRALNELLASGKATPSDVDGGVEFNGWHLYDPNYKAPKGKNFWWVQGDQYMVAFEQQPGYRILKEYAYSNWLPPAKRRIVLLEEDPQDAKSSR